MKKIKPLIISIYFFALGPIYANNPIDVIGKDAMSIGIYIEDLNTNKILYNYQCQKVYTPASTTKAITVATALSTLNANFRFETPVYISGIIKDNTLYGDIIIYGVGDPTIESAHFSQNKGFCDSIINSLKEKNINRIEGRCRFFAKNFNPNCGVNPNWEIEDIAWGYGTGLHEFNYKDNIFNLTYNDSILTTNPYVKDLSIINLPAIGSDNIELMRPFNSNDLYIVGNINGKYQRTCSTPFPQDIFYDEFISLLKKEDIEFIESEIEIADNSPKLLLYTHKSPKLIDILKDLMIRSDNLFAESILRLTSPGKSTNHAINAELATWEKRGLNTQFTTILDGSGLARANRISPNFMANILKWMYNSEYCDLYTNCFPRSGIDGTLKNFLKKTHLEGKLALKTGSMNGVQCYAGYKLNDCLRPTHIVVIMVNNFYCKRSELKATIENFLLETFKD